MSFTSSVEWLAIVLVETRRVPLSLLPLTPVDIVLETILISLCTRLLRLVPVGMAALGVHRGDLLKEFGVVEGPLVMDVPVLLPVGVALEQLLDLSAPLSLVHLQALLLGLGRPQVSLVPALYVSSQPAVSRWQLLP